MTNIIALDGKDSFFQREDVCTDAVITPGMLIERTATGVKPHATADGLADKLFAVENSDVGDDIDTDYAVGDNVIYGSVKTGARIYAWLEDEGNVARGASLASDGAGALQAAVATIDGVIVAYALEAVNNVGGTGPVRIRVEVA